MTSNGEPTKETLQAWHDDPSNWKLGFLYYNPKDTRLFPPKRWGWGLTVNFANPISILSMVGLVIIFVVIAKLIK